MTTSATCPYCAEDIPSGVPKCPICGESFEEGRSRFRRDPNAWGGAHKPKSILVLGIIGLSLGSLGLISMGFSLAMLMSFSGQANPLAGFMQGSSGYQAFQMVSMGVGLVATVVLIVAGYGLVMLKAWGRKLSLYYAMFALVQVAVGVVGNVVGLILPLLQKGGSGPELLIMSASTIGGGCVGLVFPACLLFFLTRSKVRKAFERVGEGGDSQAPPLDKV